MTEVAWETEHSVETAASPEFAWAYMTDVANWHDPPAQFRLEGPFTTGGLGATDIPGQPTRPWRLQDVRPIESYTVEFSLDRATLSFLWHFSSLPGRRTRLTQRIMLQGENAAAYLFDVQEAFTSSLEPGMNKIATAMDAAYAASQNKDRGEGLA
jgi:hypothetical protein